MVPQQQDRDNNIDLLLMFNGVSQRGDARRGGGRDRKKRRGSTR